MSSAIIGPCIQCGECLTHCICGLLKECAPSENICPSCSNGISNCTCHAKNHPSIQSREWSFSVMQAPHGFDIIWHMNKCMNFDPGKYHVIEKSAYDILDLARLEMKNQCNIALRELEQSRAEVAALLEKLANKHVEVYKRNQTLEQEITRLKELLK